MFNQVLGNPKREFFGFDKRTEKIINKTFEINSDKIQTIIVNVSLINPLQVEARVDSKVISRAIKSITLI